MIIATFARGFLNSKSAFLLIDTGWTFSPPFFASVEELERNRLIEPTLQQKNQCIDNNSCAFIITRQTSGSPVTITAFNNPRGSPSP